MAENGNILIVDDNPNNLQVLLGLLTPVGYKIRPALSGEIALRAVEISPPDLILLDVRMPGIDGYETCRRLKANAHSRDIPVIFISAMQDTEDKLAGFRAGGVDYVAKPFQAEEILARVKTHIELYRMQRHLESMVAQRTQELAQSEACYRVIFEDSPIAIIVYDTATLNVLTVNCTFTRILGYSANEAVGQQVDFAAARENRAQLRTLARQLSEHSEEAAYTGPLRFSHKDGQLVEIEGVLQRVNYPGYKAQILMLQDVTENRRVEAQLQQAAKEHKQQIKKLEHFDVLTGLPNRTYLTERMLQGTEQSKRTGCWMTVCYLDLDAFKPINELHGKDIGNKLLANVADCLRSCLRGGDTLARIGGDEFAFLLMGGHSQSELIPLLQNIQKRLAEPFISDDMHVTLSASIGVTHYPQDDSDPDTLLRHADHAMMAAKQSGKGRYEFFDPADDKRQRDQHETIELMREALARREFVLYYQPKVDLQSVRVFGAEALIRWRHPERGLLPPGAFLPAIEGDEFMVELGDWVITEALAQLSLWREAGLDISVSVNVAAQQLAQPHFIERLLQQLSAHQNLAYGGLELEVLETSTLEDIDNVEKIITDCQAMGVGFSLDDFGTGYSSLTYLRRLSADTLKIDQSFIRDMMEDPGDRAIVAGVIGLAEAFQRKVIAEGVETVEHGKFLLELGCTLLQGYGVARPMPAGDLPNWVKTWPDEAWTEVAITRANKQTHLPEES